MVLGGLVNKMDTLLSKYERQVLELYLDGLSYGKIAEQLGKTEKSIDNAIQRIRKKLSEDWIVKIKGHKKELLTGVGPVTSSLPMMRSTTWAIVAFALFQQRD